ncbi:MAG: homoserine dehydrogenase [Acidobacteriota bacterium]|jgi:homoserine dehydrogenase
MRLILVGFGTVGRGAAESLVTAAPAFAEHSASPRIVAVVDPLVGSVFRAGGLDPEQLLGLADGGTSLSEHPDAEAVAGLAEVLDRGAADVLVELTPTNLQNGQPGLDHVRAAIGAGLHVVTTNKGPIALAYRELAASARTAGVQLRFEGTVMSGTPVLNLCETGLAGAGIRGIRGVLNGTCNFILSQMESGVPYDDALADAQSRGYAEADPSGDVDGWDAAAKALILANCVLGAELEIDAVARVGIRDISTDAIEAALADGKTWRLVARVEQSDAGWRAGVEPELVDRTDPLGSLTGPGNLLVFETDALGDVVIAGPGAGRRATGHAVIADLVALARGNFG